MLTMSKDTERKAYRADAIVVDAQKLSWSDSTSHLFGGKQPRGQVTRM